MLTTTLLIVSAALVLAARPDADAATAITNEATARFADIEGAADLPAEHLTQCQLDDFDAADLDCTALDTAFRAADVADQSDLISELLQTRFQLFHGQQAAALAEIATAQTAAVEADHTAAVEDFLTIFDNTVEELEVRANLFEGEAKLEHDNVLAKLDTEFDAGEARKAKFDAIKTADAELQELIAAANKAKEDNAAIGKKQKEVQDLIKAAEADTTLVQTLLAFDGKADGARLAAVAGAIDARANANRVMRFDAEADADLEDAIESVRVHHMILNNDDAAKFAEIETAAEEYPDVTVVQLGAGAEVTYEAICSSDLIVDAEEGQSCERQMSQLAADTATNWETFYVLNIRDVEQARKFEVKNVAWKAPAAWDDKKEASDDDGYGNNKGKEEEDDDAGGAAGLTLSFAAVAAVCARFF